MQDVVGILGATRAKKAACRQSNDRARANAHCLDFFAEPVASGRMNGRLEHALVYGGDGSCPDIGFDSYERFVTSQDTIRQVVSVILIALPPQSGIVRMGNSVLSMMIFRLRRLSGRNL